ncbi:MAG TPA: nucleotide exchange factor GrpE [Blastocatellia bacterium]|nr:nucleotide exchange factor GrpE [Blastocatellia bacterium]
MNDQHAFYAAPVESEGESENIDLERLNQTLNINLNADAVKPDPANPSDDYAQSRELLEEITEDMLEMLRRLKNVEERLEQVEQLMRESSRSQAREIDALRRDLLGERKAINAMSVFNALIPTLESLRAMHTKLNHAKDVRMRAQADAVIQAMSMALRGLGFVEFQVTKGEPFDPSRMECLGFVKGEQGIVLDAVRKGYMANETIVRPAGVLIADPAHK